jgi:hypothetical protein
LQLVSRRFDPEEIDLEALVQGLRKTFGAVIEGDVVGRTVLRDQLVRRLDCSELEAEQLVDTLIARGFVEPRKDPEGLGGWRLGGPD